MRIIPGAVHLGPRVTSRGGGYRPLCYLSRMTRLSSDGSLNKLWQVFVVITHRDFGFMIFALQQLQNCSSPVFKSWDGVVTVRLVEAENLDWRLFHPNFQPRRVSLRLGTEIQYEHLLRCPEMKYEWSEKEKVINKRKCCHNHGDCYSGGPLSSLSYTYVLIIMFDTILVCLPHGWTFCYLDKHMITVQQFQSFINCPKILPVQSQSIVLPFSFVLVSLDCQSVSVYISGFTKSKYRSPLS